MNNQIKEILEFKENADYKKLSCDEIAILKDYITNLQKENEKWFAVAKDFEMEAHDLWNKNNELEQELEEYKDTETYSKRFLYKANKDRLNANLDLIKENEMLKDAQKNFEKQFIKEMDYKSRIEKAVEYIKENAKYQKATINNNKYYSEYLINQVLDILNGKE